MDSSSRPEEVSLLRSMSLEVELSEAGTYESLLRERLSSETAGASVGGTGLLVDGKGVPSSHSKVGQPSSSSAGAFSLLASE